MLRISIFLIFLNGMVLSGRAAPEESSNGWTHLFNGSDFEGWTFDVMDDSDPLAIYSAENGIVSVSGQGRPIAVMRTLDEFENYELILDWRWPGEPGNSGTLIHCSSPRNRNVWPQSLEIQLKSGNAGDFIYIGETIEVQPHQVPTVNNTASWEVRRRVRLMDDAENALSDWNRLRIVAEGDRVTVYINEKRVNYGWNASVRRGAICLQSERADIQFRDIRIRSL